jgi:hypothetical protein
MKTHLRIAAVVAAMLAAALAHAQVKQPIYVQCNAQDSDEVGKGLCSSLSNAIAKSPRYALLTSPGKEFHGVIAIISIPIDEAISASSVVFGFAAGAAPMTYLTHKVVSTGHHKVDEQAALLLVDFDNIMDAVRKATP